ncbi:MAG: cbb3-type cytochrome c oxidase subunit 3 [Oceanicaulis sp.]
MYEPLSSFAQTWGLLLFVAFFIGAAVYAFWPKNKDKFEEAARVPLEDDDRPAAAEESAGDKDRSHD